jgi:hypothetical protein
MLHALSLAKDYALMPAHIRIPDKNTSADSDIAKNFNAYTGALAQELDQFQAKNQRRANDQEIVQMAKALTVNVQAPGRFWGTNDLPAYQLTPENIGSIQVKVPDEFRAGITASFKAKGITPTEQQVQTAYLLHLNPTVTRR